MKAKGTKDKKTPRSPRKREQNLTSPPAPSAAARRSSRGISARKSYADRDDNEDEEEMMGGVAKWVYVDEDSEDQLSDEGDAEEKDAKEEKSKTPRPIEDSEVEPEPRSLDKYISMVEEVEITPSRSNTRKPKAPITWPKKNAAVVKAKTMSTKQQTNPEIEAKPKSPTMPKVSAKTPLVGRPKGKEVKGVGKGRGKSKASDIYDFDG